jgi:hypothetical protein
MKRGRRVFRIVLTGAVVVAAFVVVWPRGEREPVYQGKTLSWWIYHASAPFMESHDAPERADAVRHIGTNGLPFLVAWIRDAPKISRLDSILGVVTRKVPGPWFKPKFRNDQLAWDAVWALHELGGAARPAIPDLVQLTQNSNAYVSTIASLALYGIGTNVAPGLLEIPADFQARGPATNSAREGAPEVLEKGGAGGKPE